MRTPSHLIASALVWLLLLASPMIQAAEGDAPVAPTPHAQHHEGTPATPPTAATPQPPAKTEAEPPKPEETSGKGLVVHRAPDFCMKKDPPPHCNE